MVAPVSCDAGAVAVGAAAAAGVVVVAVLAYREGQRRMAEKTTPGEKPGKPVPNGEPVRDLVRASESPDPRAHQLLAELDIHRSNGDDAAVAAAVAQLEAAGFRL